MTEPNGKPFLTLAELALTLDRTHLLGRHFEVARLALTGLEADVTRERNGQLSLQRLLAPPPTLAAPVKAAPVKIAPIPAPNPAVHVALGELEIRGAALYRPASRRRRKPRKPKMPTRA